MDFGEALKSLKEGKKASRSGWNGKGMFICLIRGTQVKKNKLRNECRKHVGGDNGSPYIQICPHIDMRAADGSIVIGWLASQTDMLADDWLVF